MYYIFKISPIFLFSSPGRGALACYGDFWYPVRLIQLKRGEGWLVRWWRGCVFQRHGIKPGSITTVTEPNLADSLWGDRIARRKIRVSAQLPTRQIYEFLL